MAKKTSNWFSHDCDATNDKKIVMLIAEYGYEGYGYWWRILEILRKENKVSLSQLGQRKNKFLAARN